MLRPTLPPASQLYPGPTQRSTLFPKRPPPASSYRPARPPPVTVIPRDRRAGLVCPLLPVPLLRVFLPWRCRLAQRFCHYFHCRLGRFGTSMLLLWQALQPGGRKAIAWMSSSVALTCLLQPIERVADCPSLSSSAPLLVRVCHELLGACDAAAVVCPARASACPAPLACAGSCCWRGIYC